MKTRRVNNRAFQESISAAFAALGNADAALLHELIVKEAGRLGFTYRREGGELETMNLMLVPSFFTGPQVDYLTEISLACRRGVSSVYRAWFDDDRLASMLPFDEGEGEWIRKCHKSRSASEEPLWYRLDAHFHMRDEAWKDKISIFEINACAVGGIHYGPVAEALFLDTVMPAIKGRIDVMARISLMPDSRRLLGGLLAEEAGALGRGARSFVFLEDMGADEGITEGPSIVEFLRSTGVDISLADPRDLHVKDGELYCKDKIADVVYRNFEIRDIMEMEREGGDISGVRHAFMTNRMVSSLCGEFDHKSIWEVLTSVEFEGYFSSGDARLFKKHLLWTRIMRERRTSSAEGAVVDMVPYILKNKNDFVIKPNRLFGGYGVTMGRDAASGEWDEAVERALTDGGNWVVQKYGEPERYVFPIFEDGALTFKEHNIVYGLSSTAMGSAVLGRVSTKNIVNVAQHGGLMPVLRTY